LIKAVSNAEKFRTGFQLVNKSAIASEIPKPTISLNHNKLPIKLTSKNTYLPADVNVKSKAPKFKLYFLTY